ncbi:threonine synthase [Paenibacillus allorhizosphaerae]|uniref:Threonine synthase n=1 Tax=Paenibacillus allorhizosphaerae TaxID=2849866 RepID=A0ABN7TM29_9BACL|nr:threonine synthase [Paenibacillus allorhizosphaerae]CAG7646525.1 Threonine synthase [Paenibacillus allorhizosphaerae]
MNKFWQTCARCARTVRFSLSGRCGCGGTLLVEYDMERIRSTVHKSALKERPATMWRYKELLPLAREQSIVTLGEGWTPLLSMKPLERKLNVRQVWVKREEQNPTGSFKSRGFSSTISLLKEHGIDYVAVPSNGNAASAMAAYAARAEMRSAVIVPKDCPGIIIEECLRYGASTYVVDGMIHDASRIIEEGAQEQGWFHAGTLKEPGRVEGKKTMGLELAEQLGWMLPDVIIYPTGGGSGIVGMWKAFQELLQLKWIGGKLPRFVSVQEAGCQPLVDALRTGAFVPPSTETVTSKPTGLRVPNPPDGELVVQIVKQSQGTALGVTAEQIREAQMQMGRLGISSSPEGAATLAGLIQLREGGWITRGESVVLFNTSHADKYLPWTPPAAVPVIRSYEDLREHQRKAGRG